MMFILLGLFIYAYSDYMGKHGEPTVGSIGLALSLLCAIAGLHGIWQKLTGRPR